MPGYDEIFKEAIEEAKAKVAAEEAAKSASASQSQEQLMSTVKTLADVLPQVVNGQKTLADRMAAMEATRRPSPQSGDDNPYSALEDFGITRSHLAPVLAHEVSPLIEKTVEKVFDNKFGPALRETAAIQEYQNQHPDFDINKLNRYLAANPEVNTMVQKATKSGAYELGVAYAETRRVMDERIAQEAKVQGRADKRRQLINETRPDAAILGGSGASTSSREVGKKMLSPEQIGAIYKKADAGDWKSFDEMLVKPNLPDEEWFQKLAQS